MLLLERCDCDLGSLIYPKAGSEEEGQLSAPLMMKIATEMADGLAYLHSRGIKHLDMKPGNVLMVREGKAEGWSVRIADFGMEDDKEDDGDRQSKEDDEVYGTWECVTTAAPVLPFASPPAAGACARPAPRPALALAPFWLNRLGTLARPMWSPWLAHGFHPPIQHVGRWPAVL